MGTQFLIQNLPVLLYLYKMSAVLLLLLLVSPTLPNQAFTHLYYGYTQEELDIYIDKWENEPGMEIKKILLNGDSCHCKAPTILSTTLTFPPPGSASASSSSGGETTLAGGTTITQLLLQSSVEALRLTTTTITPTVATTTTATATTDTTTTTTTTTTTVTLLSSFVQRVTKATTEGATTGETTTGAAFTEINPSSVVNREAW